MYAYSQTSSAHGQTITMEFLEGKTIYSYIEAHGALGEDIAKPLARKLISAFYYMHSKGIAHRDIKGENIIVNSNLDPTILDFGLCDH